MSSNPTRLTGSREAGSRTELVQVNFRAEDGSWQTQTRPQSTSVPTQNNASGSSSNTAQANAQSGGVNNAGIAPKESSKGSAQGLANKEYVEHEFFTLQGDCSLIPNAKTARIKMGDTVSCLGLGKYLSGKYFVDEVTRTIDNSGGYSHSISVQKNGFGDSLKGGLHDDRPKAVSKEVEGRRHVVIAGDTLNSLALHYYGSVGYALRIANANLLDIGFSEALKVSKELIIP